MPRPPQEIPILPDVNAKPEPAPAPKPKPRLTERNQDSLPSHGPSPRQTLSYLRGLMENHGLEPKAKLGQNFLIDLNLIDVVIRAADLSYEDCVLEVGTGTGSLTAQLAKEAGAVFTVEIDRDFHRLAQTIIGGRSNVVSYLGDALERKNELNPEVLSGLKELAAKFETRQFKLIANLPYAVATPIISNLLLLPDFPIERMVVMVQWEIGERLRALVGTKDYNALSVLVQSVADVETVRKVAPSNFFPKPKVDSAIMLIKPNPKKREAVGDVAKFRAFLRDLYTHRRKNLRAALAGWPQEQGRHEKADVDRILKEIGIDGNVRAETLDLEQHLRLSRAFT
jgi:16S rRNA (adenine1518-N6/adenine1519-N6)-dimethyltransferase